MYAEAGVARTLLCSAAMRILVSSMIFLAACATEDPVGPPAPLPIDEIWADTIHPGDMIVTVPGTGSYDYLAATIEPLPGSAPLVDVRAIPKVADDAITFEQAIAAAHRAGITNEQLEAGAVTFALWGAGFTRLSAFDYLSYEGLKIRFVIIGGKNACAVGRVVDNLLNYSTSNVAKDAADLYAKIQTWVAANPTATGVPRNVIVASHSYGGAVAEYLAFERAGIVAGLGPLANAAMPFTIAAGVPALIPDYTFAGPSFRDLDDGWLYEIDRPDDPVHAMNPSGNPDGHQYDILFGNDYQGSYGVTTTAISCRSVPGPCPLP